MRYMDDARKTTSCGHPNSDTPTAGCVGAAQLQAVRHPLEGRAPALDDGNTATHTVIDSAARQRDMRPRSDVKEMQP